MSLRSNNNTFFKKYRLEAEKYLFSPSATEAFLRQTETDLGLTGLGVSVSLPDVAHRWGDCNGKQALSGKIADANASVIVYLSQDSDCTGVEVQQNLHALLETFKLMWVNECRNDHGGLNLKASGTEDLFLTAIRNMSDPSTPCMYSIAYIDLDNFKPINDLCNHDTGNKALRKVYAEMHNLVRDLNGFAFFDGGDEFILVFPHTNRLEICSGIWSLLKKIQSERYGDRNLSIGFSAGIVIREDIEILTDFQKIKNDCENLTKNKDAAKTKRRGMVSFEQEAKNSLPQEKKISVEKLYKLGISLSRCMNYTNHPFKDERLNLIADQAYDFYLNPTENSSINIKVKEIIDWFGSELISDVLESSILHSVESYSTISKHAVTIAVAHGLARALIATNNKQFKRSPKTKKSIDKITLHWGSTNGKKVQVRLNGSVFWGDDLPSKVKDIEYGSPINITTEVQNTGLFAGVQIGFDNKALTPGGNELPNIFLADHVKVDMRPKTGGGLPDFWQVAIAQVVSCLGKLDVNVLVWGDAASSSETYKKLIEPTTWAIDEIAHLTGLTSDVIRHVSEKIKDKVIIVKSSDHMLDQIYNSYQEIIQFTSQGIDQNTGLNDPLPRPMAATTPLPQSEGVVCTTAAIAYPIIIDTLRKSQDLRNSKDDAGESQKELIAFKLKLTTPLTNPIPRYLEKQKEELNSYAENVLLNDKGVIRKYLEKTNQREAFVKHLAKYVGDTKKRSTRRACMVVPHEPDPSAEDFPSPRPWGLISVWATPRYTENGICLDFAFVWRTVEAFIGLPYSLYGSIRLAEQMLEQVRNEISTKSRKPSVIILGELNYIALSLHLGGDQFHSRVAKQIVDLASD